MNKNAALLHWMGLPDGLPILEHFIPIKYKATGSNYGACGIRIDGPPAFIDAVLSRLKDVIDGENQVTRLGLTRSKVVPKEFNGKQRDYPNAVLDAEVCYVRLHQRGIEGAVMLALTKAHSGATDRYEQATRAWGKTEPVRKDLATVAKPPKRLRSKAAEHPIQFTAEYKAERAKVAAARKAASAKPVKPPVDLKAALKASLKKGRGR
jgi:hypothetical protein